MDPAPVRDWWKLWLYVTFDRYCPSQCDNAKTVVWYVGCLVRRVAERFSRTASSSIFEAMRGFQALIALITDPTPWMLISRLRFHAGTLRLIT